MLVFSEEIRFNLRREVIRNEKGHFRIRGTRKRGSYINAVTVSASKCELNEQSTTCRLRPLLKVYAVILL